MSRIKLLLDVVEDMNALSESLKTLAEAMMEGRAEETEPAKESPKKEEKPEPVKQEEPKKEEPQKAELTYTKEDVRKALAAKSSEGKTKEVKELLMCHGGGKLSAIDPTEYAAMMEEVKGI